MAGCDPATLRLPCSAHGADLRYRPRDRVGNKFAELIGRQPASSSARCKLAAIELVQIEKQKLQGNPVGVSEVKHAANASDIANS